MTRSSLLVVHPDSSIRALVASMLKTLGHRIEEADCDRTAVRLVEASPPSLVLVAVDPGDADAMEMLDYMRRKHPSVPTILLFPEPHPERAREAMKRGAASVLRYPTSANNLRAAVSQALEERGRPAEIRSIHVPEGRPTRAMDPVAYSEPRNGHASNGAANGLEAKSADRGPANGPAAGLLGRDSALLHAVELAGSIARTLAPVLILGERGTGKGLLARAIHEGGARRDGPFIEVTCGSQTEAILEAELFGAPGERPGKIEQARGGTLLIQEAALLSPALQLKLMKWIEEADSARERPERSGPAEARLIVCSREDLCALVEEGAFRQDLYHRIGVVSLKLPPLRHRGSDVLVLAEHFRAAYAGDLGKSVTGFTAETLEAIRSYSWPGNVLELENAVERGVVLCRTGRIELGHLALPRRTPAAKEQDRPAGSSGSAPSVNGILPLKEALEAPERQLILQALEALSWNRQETARVLDINRTTLYKKMKKYGLLIEEPAWVH